MYKPKESKILQEFVTCSTQRFTDESFKRLDNKKKIGVKFLFIFLL